MYKFTSNKDIICFNNTLYLNVILFHSSQHCGCNQRFCCPTTGRSLESSFERGKGKDCPITLVSVSLLQTLIFLL